MEARVGIEPTNAAFAEPCLTTWLPRRHVFTISYSSVTARRFTAFCLDDLGFIRACGFDLVGGLE